MPTIKSIDSAITRTAPANAELNSTDGLLIQPPVRHQASGFDKPLPLFESDLQRHHKFGYYFGIDDLSFKSVKVNQTCGKVTKPIKVGKVDALELEARYTVSESSSIEFSIIDQDREYPILPADETTVRNERIFFGLPLRFSLDQSKPYTIKKDGMVVSTTVEAAMQANDGIYTITYTPLGGKQYEPTEEDVQLKIIMRLYNEKAEVPFLKSASFKGFGGDALWIDRL